MREVSYCDLRFDYVDIICLGQGRTVRLSYTAYRQQDASKAHQADCTNPEYVVPKSSPMTRRSAALVLAIADCAMQLCRLVAVAVIVLSLELSCRSFFDVQGSNVCEKCLVLV